MQCDVGASVIFSLGGRMKQGSRPSKSRLVFEQLEPRVLFSADPLFVPFDGGVLQADVEQQSILHADLFSTTNPTSADVAAEVRRELVFVDASAEDYQQLLDDLGSNDDPSRQFDVVLLTSDRDGIDQITEALQEYDDLDAVHIVSHGTDGAVKLGGTWLNIDNLNAYAGQIASWQDSLTSEADLLFYGCDLAANEDGKLLVDSLSALTEADVAASTDNTGHAIFGADWDLEYTAGTIETGVAFSIDVQQNWGHLLNVAVDATSTGQTSGSGVLISHTTSGSEPLMLVGISFGRDEFESVSSVTYNGTNLTLVGAQDHSQPDRARVEIWSLVAPDTGTYDVVVNLTGSIHRGASIGVMTFNGVDQTSALGTFGSAEGTSAAPSATIASATGELVFGVVAFDSTSDQDLSPGAGQTEYWDLFIDRANGAGSTEAGAASVVTSWSGVPIGEWVVGGVSIKSSTANTPPSIANLAGDNLAYSEGAGALIIDQGTAASITDVDSADFDSGNLTITISAGAVPTEDVLAIDISGTVSLSAGTSVGSTVSVGGIAIGTITSAGIAGSDLVVSFTANATTARVTTLVQAVTYENTDTATPTPGARTVGFSINDGDGATSVTYDATVTVTPTNDEQVLATNTGVTVAEASTGTVITSAMLATTTSTIRRCSLSTR